MSFCQFHTNRPMKGGKFINCNGNSETHHNNPNLDGHEQEHSGEEIKNNSEQNPCNQCSDEINNDNMCEHSTENEGCKFHSKHRRNSESNFRDGFTNIRCKFCWYINRIHNSKIKEAQNCFQTHIKCVYCLNDVSIKNLKPSSSISHPYCNKCQMSTDGTQGPFSHTDCKYCQNSCNGRKRLHKQKPHFPHTDCKYCHDANCESTDSSFEECDEMCPMSYNQYVPCSAHDTPYRYSHNYPRNNRTFPSKHHSYLHDHLEDSPDIDYIRETLRGINLSSTFEIPENIDGRDIRFRSCEYCMKNGESAVIYNSHQFQNRSGVITCPLVRQYGPERDFHYCPHNNDNFINTMYSNGGSCKQHTPFVSDYPNFYSRKINGRRGYRYSF